MDRTLIDEAKMGAAGLNRLPVFLLVALLTAFMVLLLGCGKKGPPFLPEKKLAAKVDRLTGKWENGQARLEGYIKGDDKNNVDGTCCRVYLVWYSADSPPCQGCPIKMTGFKEIKEKVVSGDRFTCDVPGVEKKGIWFFEVRLIGRNGAIGPPSDKVKLKIED